MWGIVWRAAVSALVMVIYTRFVFKLGASYALQKVTSQTSEDIRELIKILFEQEGTKEDDEEEER